MNGQSSQGARQITAEWYGLASDEQLQRATELRKLTGLKTRGAVIAKDGMWGEGVDISASCSQTGFAVAVNIKEQPVVTFTDLVPRSLFNANFSSFGKALFYGGFYE